MSCDFNLLLDKVWITSAIHGGGGELSETVEFDYVIVGAGSAGCMLANSPQRRWKEFGTDCSKPARRIPISGFTCRSDMASCSRTTASTGCTRPNRSRDWAGVRCSAARQGARRLELDQRPAFTFAASTRITIAGASTATPAGAYEDVFAVFQEGREPAARGRQVSRRRRSAAGVGTGGTADPLSEAFVAAQRRPASPQIPTSTARRRKARACSRSTTRRGRRRVRRFPIFDRPKGAAI